MERCVWSATLEVRRRGRRLGGSFPYNRTATRSNRGTVRKERFASRAFAYSVGIPDREIHLLSGHSFDKPLASKLAGSLEVEDTAEALNFEASLPARSDQPTWMRDTVLAVENGLSTGISPGFMVPPASAVPDAVKLIPEPGNEAVMIREIRAAVLTELSVVTRAVYPEAGVELRRLEEWANRTYHPSIRVYV